jgi:hypothetical protein
MMETILVAGAGLVDSLLSIYLALGHQAHVFDRYPDFRGARPDSPCDPLTLEP